MAEKPDAVALAAVDTHYSAISLVLMLTVSDRAALIVILFCPLWLALRFDNDLGAFFIITVLLYIVFFVIGLLFAAIVALGTYGTVGGI